MDKVGFFPRLISYIIDWIIVAMVALILFWIFGLFSFVTAEPVVSKNPFTSSHVIGGALAVLWWMVYYVYFWASSGQTLGKMILGIEVISATDGGRIGVANAIVRLFGYLVSFMILGLGFLWIIWDRNKQGWHDKFARTYVVKK